MSGVEEEHEDVLQNIEAFIMEVFRAHDHMVDTDVMRALDAGLVYFNDVRREHTPKEPRLSGHSVLVFDAVKTVCNVRLGREELDARTKAKDNLDLSGGDVSPEVILACLRKIRKSVDRWNKQGGRQGYLRFVAQFIR